jgi:hypothetical protein
MSNFFDKIPAELLSRAIAEHNADFPAGQVPIPRIPHFEQINSFRKKISFRKKLSLQKKLSLRKN